MWSPLLPCAAGLAVGRLRDRSVCRASVRAAPPWQVGPETRGRLAGCPKFHATSTLVFKELCRRPQPATHAATWQADPTGYSLEPARARQRLHRPHKTTWVRTGLPPTCFI